ncbi:hypothetical protein ACOSQ2_005846 [Xanthoceras sorbifolium]
MIPGGHMLLTIIGNSSKDRGYTVWELLDITVLHDMVLEGLIEQTKLDHFNLPYYAPAPEEVRHETEACFRIQQFDIFYVDWDANFLVIKMVAQGKVLLIIDMQEARVLPRVYEQWPSLC